MSESSTGTGPGDKMVGITGIASMMVYLVLLFSFLTYVMVKVWSHCQPDGSVAKPTSTPTPTPKPDQQSTQATGQQSSQTGGQQAPPKSDQPKADEIKADQSQKFSCSDPSEVTFFWGATWIWWEVRLLLIVIVSGAMGSLVHALRSMYWYIGNKSLKWSWLAMYVLLPFCGGALGLVFYFVIRGGFFAPQGQAGAANPFGFAAVSALIGMFSQQAVIKLQEVAETLLAKPKPGSDSKPQGPAPAKPPSGDKPPVKVEQLTPNSGVQAGNETVEITGSGFVSGASVTFGGVAATVSAVEATKITVTTPSHAAGAVDIIVTNPDGGGGKLAGGFTYS